MQRNLDILLSLSALLLIMPFVVPVMFLLRFTGEGKIFYYQERVGKGGRIFKLIKFATMLENSPNIGAGSITLKNDPRVLPFGKLLRKTKINELPQLLNVLMGDMSLVGPRPLTPKNYAYYSSDVKHVLETVVPGLSGVGSIVFRNEEFFLSDLENPIQFYEKVISPYKGRLEVWFVENNSLRLYVELIFITLLSVLCPNNRVVLNFAKRLPDPPYELTKKLQ